MNKKLFTFSNILTGLFIVFILVLLFNPTAKARVIQGLMKIGLFQPSLPENYEIKKDNGGNSLPNGNINFKNYDGSFFTLADQKGKVVFINFWATWCPPCIAEMPSIEKLYKKFEGQKEVVFLMVDVDNDFKKSKAFLEKNGYNFPLHQLAGGIPDEYYSGTLPTTLIIDKTGNIAYRHTGSADYSNSEVEEFINKLVKK